MLIHGLQKLTLLDFPGRTACTVFTGGCNYRCPFCHNASLVLHPEGQPLIPEAEVLAYLEKRRGLLDGVCVTGGEPTMQAGLPAFLEKIRALGYAVKLDTNGTAPALLRELLAAGLVDYIAMDVKTCRENYAAVCGIPDYDTAAVEASAALLLGGGADYEFRTTVVRELHRVEDFTRIGAWLAGAKRYFLQSYKDSGDVLAAGLSPCAKEELTAMLAATRAYIPAAALRGVD